MRSEQESPHFATRMSEPTIASPIRRREPSGDEMAFLKAKADTYRETERITQDYFAKWPTVDFFPQRDLNSKI
jgi:hypothetical protein